ncbi:MAG: 1-acyl-sn-glycerol-3-phosphate acyltransferase [Actinobacteria bacterium]|nr:1-acyl-sn-glycerol-3-phosphate acyltransferase [Actinomycetota bacterium]
MAEMKPQVYKDPRPAEYFDQFHQAARRGSTWVYTLARIVCTLPTILIYRLKVVGRHNVPRRGGLILAPNHFSQMDHFFAGVYLPRTIRFMAKSQLFGPPVLTAILKHAGVFPVRRGQRDEEAMKTAFTLLEQGEMVLIYAEGGRSRSGELGEPKRGIGRIALESGVPMVPVAIYGSAGIRKWKRLRFPQVTIEFGEPRAFPVEKGVSPERQLEVATEIFAAVKELYGGLATRNAARSGSRTPDRAQA